MMGKIGNSRGTCESRCKREVDDRGSLQRENRKAGRQDLRTRDRRTGKEIGGMEDKQGRKENAKTIRRDGHRAFLMVRWKRRHMSG